MSNLFKSTAIVLTTAALAMGSSFSVPAHTFAAGGTSITLPVWGVGEGQLQGVNLYLEAQAPLEILEVDMVAGVFAANNTGPWTWTYPAAPAKQWAEGCITTDLDTVALPGLVANVTLFVPGGTPEGDYFFRTEIPQMGWISDWAGSMGATLESQGSGFVHVPEPASVLMICLAGACFLRPRGF